MLPVSNDTLLRIVRRRGSPRFVPPTVIGIDDWRGDEIKAMGRSSVTLSGARPSPCCLTANSEGCRPPIPK
ncbi:hypothetical protein GCM10010869_49500 [Mesorhizobium tianshanense]|nr:hypothetical protein GCM10010869_49500 [Mesorhizobium tianshanense]